MRLIILILKMNQLAQVEAVASLYSQTRQVRKVRDREGIERESAPPGEGDGDAGASVTEACRRRLLYPGSLCRWGCPQLRLRGTPRGQEEVAMNGFTVRNLRATDGSEDAALKVTWQR